MPIQPVESGAQCSCISFDAQAEKLAARDVRRAGFHGYPIRPNPIRTDLGFYKTDLGGFGFEKFYPSRIRVGFGIR